jgi:hypothetical protein
MKALKTIFLISIIAPAYYSVSFSQEPNQPDSINVTKATADTVEVIHQDLSIAGSDPLKPGNIYYFLSYRNDNQVGEIIKIDSNSITIKNHEFEIHKIKRSRLRWVYNIMTNPVFRYAKPHRADILLKEGTTYTDAKIKKLKVDSLIIKISSGAISIPVEKIQSVDFAETPPLISNARDIGYLLILWPLLPFYYFMDPALDTEFDFSYMDLKWKNAMLRCLISYHYPGECDPYKY